MFGNSVHKGDHNSRGNLWRKKRTVGWTEEPTKEPVVKNLAEGMANGWKSTVKGCCQS